VLAGCSCYEVYIDESLNLLCMY